MIAPGVQSLLLSSKVRRIKGHSLPESCQTFEVAEARTSGPVNLVVSRQTGFLSPSIRLLINRLS